MREHFSRKKIHTYTKVYQSIVNHTFIAVRQLHCTYTEFGRFWAFPYTKCAQCVILRA